MVLKPIRMKLRLLSLFILLSAAFGLKAQTLCPGGGTNYSNAVLFDPTWIAGCANATTCNPSGGVALFDNTSACEPTAAMDACAPVPSCTVDLNESDLWFKWYAISTTATCIINNSGNSWVAGVQLFSQPGGSCGTLVELPGGCGVDAHANATLTVPLSGLVPGQLYYMRTYGSSSSVVQRVGKLCFCGTVGLTNAPLALNLLNFSAKAQNRIVTLKWAIDPSSTSMNFDVERSIDNSYFEKVSTINVTNGVTSYQTTDQPSANRVIFYRLRSETTTGRVEYSKVIAVNIAGRSDFSFQSNLVSSILNVDAADNLSVSIINMSGAVLSNHKLTMGTNQINVSNLPNGVYFLHSQGGDMQKFVVAH
jgi:hypothetical protein